MGLVDEQLCEETYCITDGESITQSDQIDIVTIPMFDEKNLPETTTQLIGTVNCLQNKPVTQWEIKTYETIRSYYPSGYNHSVIAELLNDLQIPTYKQRVGRSFKWCSEMVKSIMFRVEEHLGVFRSNQIDTNFYGSKTYYDYIAGLVYPLRKNDWTYERIATELKVKKYPCRVKTKTNWDSRLVNKILLAFIRNNKL